MAWDLALFKFAPVASSLTPYPILNYRDFIWWRHEGSDVVRIHDYRRLTLSPVHSDSPRLMFEMIYQRIDTEREKQHAEQAPLADQELNRERCCHMSLYLYHGRCVCVHVSYLIHERVAKAVIVKFIEWILGDLIESVSEVQC